MGGKADISASTITTIHGFCAALLRERPVEAAVPPRFEVLDALGQELLLERLWEDWIEERLNEDGPIARARIEGVKREELREFVIQLLEHREQARFLPRASELPGALGEFLVVYGAEKRRRGVLDFDDLLLRCRDLLRTHPEVRAALRRRFEQVLVDEFQDTDPVQAEVFWLLAAPGELPDTWWEIPPEPGRLFVVGDPKQTIYGFRRADLELFEQASRSLETSLKGKPGELWTNRRSIPRILDWVNAAFGTDLKPLRGNGDAPDGGVFVLLPSEPLVGKKMSEVREAEARAIASFLRERQGRTPAGRCAILMKARADVEVYERALVEAGLPVIVEGGRHYFRRREVRLLVHALRAIDNPQDALAVVAVLRSPFCGASDRDLALHAAAGGGWDYTKPIPDESPATVAEGLRRLARERARRHEVPPAVFVERMLQEHGLLGFFLVGPDGPQRVANLLQLVRAARELESREPLTFSSLARHLSEGVTRLREEALPSIAEAGDAVRIMTMHHAKGLEFDLVVLADLFRGPKRWDEPLVYRRQAGSLEVKIGRVYESPAFEEGVAEEEGRQREEERRLLYVAATRARDVLVLPRFVGTGSHAPKKGTLFHLLPEWLQRLPDDAGEGEREGVLLVRPRPFEPTERRETPDGAKELAAWSNRREAFLGRERRLKERQRRGVAPLRPSDLGGGGPSGSGGFGPSAGSAVHWALGLPGWPEEKEAISRLEARCTLLGLAEGERDHARRCLRNALGLPLLTRARAARRCFREVPFDLELDGRVVRGSIDLLFEEDGRWVVADYKTDAVSRREAPAGAERYLPQARVYARAVEGILGEKVKEIVFAFLAPGAEVAIPYSSSA